MQSEFDYIVLGCGGIGSAAVYWLARRAGAQVLGLEQFKLGHERGGSQDFSRIIRLAYHHEHYTRLLPHAYAAWQALEDDSTLKLLYPCGELEMAFAHGPQQGRIQEYAEAMDAVGIPYERLDGAEVMRRYPQFRFDSEVDALWQADTAIIEAARANAAHVALARFYGATVLDECGVQAVRPVDGGVLLDTTCGTFRCRRLVVTVGSWTDKLLARLGHNLGLTVTQEQVTYFATPNVRDFVIGKFPFFTWHGAEMLYALPICGVVATKIGIDAAGPVVTADSRTFEPDPAREARVRDFLQEHVPGFLGPIVLTKTCLYDMPRDRNLVIDSLPGLPQILVCCGAGHGFKFAGVLGQALSELAIDGGTDYPIGPFTMRRPAISDPGYPKEFQL